MAGKTPEGEIGKTWGGFQAWRARWAYLISLALLPAIMVLAGCFFFAFPSDFSDPGVAVWALIMISLPAAGSVIFYFLWKHYENEN